MVKWLLIILFIPFFSAKAQVSDPLKELKSFTRNQPLKVKIDSTPFLDLTYQKGLHYFLPFYKAFMQEKKMLANDTSGYYEQLAEAAAFLDDNSSAIAYEKASYEKLPDSLKPEIRKLADAAKEVLYVDAKKYILSKAKQSRVVMINEAHDKPQTRVFTASLLEEMYQLGFHYLAMEMLYNKKTVQHVNASTGYYSNEPVAGELIRRAIAIGYTLVPYEDTVADHNANQHEYAQAENIYRFLSRQKDTAAKIIVLAGYDHIKESSATDRIPMAAYFKILSKTDPLTIDQTEMTEGSTTAYCNAVYDAWMQKNPVIGAVVPLKNDKPFDPFELNLYDIHVIHPPTRYINARPDWVSMNGLRQETQVLPAFRSLFLVQAYYAKEYTDATANIAVPADQTYAAAQNGVYYLYLQKGKYKLVCRDKNYEILGTKEMEVK